MKRFLPVGLIRSPMIIGFSQKVTVFEYEHTFVFLAVSGIKASLLHVWLSMAPIPAEEIKSHFPNIYQHCLDEGYDVTKEPIPVVPSQHYFMGGIDVDRNSKTSMNRLYAVGETACNGVHGRNRLASNSLLESLVFAKRAANHITDTYTEAAQASEITINPRQYEGYAEKYKEAVLAAIEKEKNSHE